LGRQVQLELQLTAYAAGELSLEEQEQLEATLARSPAGRSRLVELAKIARQAPSSRVRERVLAELPAAPARAAARSTPRRLQRGWLAAAAAAVIALVAIGTQFGPSSNPAVAVRDFEIHMKGMILADRSNTAPIPADPDQEYRFHADSVVEIMAKTVEGSSRAGIDFGLYLLRGDQLERLNIEAVPERYCTLFSATAREIVGDRPGLYSLFVLSAATGALPDQLPAGSDPVASLETTSGGKAQAVPPVVIIADSP
jgi:hypothetical protein